jgi:predicted flap endonuclease-1-like 5' DNA nuclease
MKKEYIKKDNAYNVTFNYNVVPQNPVHSVVVLGDFNEWSLTSAFVLSPNKKGDFEGKFKIPAGRDYHFRYLVNGERWANEKDSDRFESSPLLPHIDNSVISLPIIEEITVKKVTEKKSIAAASREAKELVAKKTSAPKPASKKETPAKAAKTTKDDLTKIEGIGPKIDELLQKAGIKTFADLASAKKSTLKELLDAAGPRFAVHDPSTWAKQANLAANEKWDQLKKLQAELKGGK